MGDVDRLVADLEKAIRLDYDAKIATLEEERDDKIARVREVMGANETRGGGGTSKKRPPARPAAPPTASSAKQPSNGGATLTDRVRAAVLAQTSDFDPAAILAALPDMERGIVVPILRRLSDAGEIKLIKAGNRNASPPVYRAKGKAAVAPVKLVPEKPKAATPAPAAAKTGEARLAKVRAWILARSSSFTKADVVREFAATAEDYPLAIDAMLTEAVKAGRLESTKARDKAGAELFTPVRQEARA